MYKILNKLKDHEDAWPFLEPVDEEIAPSYYRVVKTPMDLQQMEDKLNKDLYQTFGQFKHDFQLIIANCKQYNGSTNGKLLKKIKPLFLDFMLMLTF
jgi:hypothetical protein